MMLGSNSANSPNVWNTALPAGAVLFGSLGQPTGPAAAVRGFS
jgi:hypothetical protein